MRPEDLAGVTFAELDLGPPGSKVPIATRPAPVGRSGETSNKPDLTARFRGRILSRLLE